MMCQIVSDERWPGATCSIAVQPYRSTGRLKCRQTAREHCPGNPGKNIACASTCQPRRRRRINRDTAIGRGDHAIRTFQDNRPP